MFLMRNPFYYIFYIMHEYLVKYFFLHLKNKNTFYFTLKIENTR